MQHSTCMSAPHTWHAPKCARSYRQLIRNPETDTHTLLGDMCMRPHHTRPPHHPSHRCAQGHLDAPCCRPIVPLHDNYCWHFLSTPFVPGSILDLLINISHQSHGLGTFTIFQRGTLRHREAQQLAQSHPALKRWCQGSGTSRLAQSFHTAIVRYGAHHSCLSSFTTQLAGTHEAPTETGQIPQGSDRVSL